METEIQRINADEIAAWLEGGRIPAGYYGKITVPIEDGKVQIVIVEEKTRPVRRKMSNV